MEWISVKDRLPNDFNDRSRLAKSYLTYIDNPFFNDGNCNVAKFQQSDFGNVWVGIEPSVSRGNDFPNVTHWMELPEPPKN